MITVSAFWMILFHWDLERYKTFAVNELFLKEQESLMHISKISYERRGSKDIGRHSGQKRMTTRSLIDTYRINEQKFLNLKPQYLYLQGRHSISFYLKCGMAGMLTKR